MASSVKSLYKFALQKNQYSDYYNIEFAFVFCTCNGDI